MQKDSVCLIQYIPYFYYNCVVDIMNGLGEVGDVYSFLCVRTMFGFGQATNFCNIVMKC